MTTIDIKITNLAQIKRAFGLAPRLMVSELNSAIRLTIFAIGRLSRINTPVDTGRLRASTYEKFGNLKGEVGTNTEYDFFVHEGTKFMTARPYLRNAVRASSSQIDANFKNAVQNVLDKIASQT